MVNRSGELWELITFRCDPDTKDATREIGNAVTEVDTFVPIIQNQRQVNPRMY